MLKEIQEDNGSRNGRKRHHSACNYHAAKLLSSNSLYLILTPPIYKSIIIILIIEAPCPTLQKFFLRSNQGVGSLFSRSSLLLLSFQAYPTVCLHLGQSTGRTAQGLPEARFFQSLRLVKAAEPSVKFQVSSSKFKVLCKQSGRADRSVFCLTNNTG